MGEDALQGLRQLAATNSYEADLIQVLDRNGVRWGVWTREGLVLGERGRPDGLEEGLPRTIFDFEESLIAQRPIAVGPHCYGCTAGAGSSCGGSLV